MNKLWNHINLSSIISSLLFLSPTASCLPSLPIRHSFLVGFGEVTWPLWVLVLGAYQGMKMMKWMWRYMKQVEGHGKYTLVIRDRDRLRLAQVKGGCWKEIGASHRGFPGPESGIWEISRITQPASGLFSGCLDCYPCFSVTSHSFSSR